MNSVFLILTLFSFFTSHAGYFDTWKKLAREEMKKTYAYSLYESTRGIYLNHKIIQNFKILTSKIEQEGAYQYSSKDNKFYPQPGIVEGVKFLTTANHMLTKLNPPDSEPITEISPEKERSFVQDITTIDNEIDHTVNESLNKLNEAVALKDKAKIANSKHMQYISEILVIAGLYTTCPKYLQDSSHAFIAALTLCEASKR